MKENKKISLKSIIFVLFIILILIVAIIVSFKFFIKDEVSENKISKNYIYNEKIESIVIKYYEGYNIATGDVINDTIPLNQIELENADLNEVSNLIKKLTKVKYSKNDERYEHVQHDYICDYYELEINDNFVIYIGEEYGIVENTEDYFKVSEDLYEKVLEIVQENNEENVYKKINSEEISIVYNEEIFKVTDNEQLKKLSESQYYVINASADDFKDEKIIYTLVLGDGRKIGIYKASVLSCIYYEDGTQEYIYTGNLEEHVEKIFENSKVKIYTENVEAIIVTYQAKEYVIEEQNKIEELLKEFKNLEYNDYSYLDSMSEEDFDENDIKIHVNNSKYIIPGNSSWGSRFYIDEDGKLYDVSGFDNNKLETYFKELVNYEE